MSKILFYLVGNQKTASTRLRLLQYIPYLRQAGIQFRLLSPSANRVQKAIRPLKSGLGLAWADTVFIQKTLLSPDIIQKARSTGKRVIFDYDDALFALPEYIAEGGELKKKKLDELLSSVDLVICGNQFLENYTQKFNDRTLILPTPVNTGRFARTEPYQDHENIIIGWIGDPKNQTFLADLIPAFSKLANQYPSLKFRVVSKGKQIELPENLAKAFEFIQWELDQEPDEIQKFDIGIMPVRDDDWSKGKCGLKLLQYMAMGIPVVGTPIGVNAEIIADGKNGYWAANIEEWGDRLSSLIANYPLRKTMGENGLKTAQDYSLEYLSKEFIKALISAHPSD